MIPVQVAMAEYDELLTLVKEWKLRWFGCISGSLAGVTLTSSLVSHIGGNGGQRERWDDNIKGRTVMDSASTTRSDEERARWKRIVVKSDSVVPHQPCKVLE